MFKKILGTFAPLLGRLLGGELGEDVVRKVANVLLPGEQNPSEESLENALRNMTPEQRVEIERINKTYEVAMAEIGFKDRDSARNMSIVKSDNTTKIIIFALFGYLMIVGILVPLFFPEIAVSAIITDTMMDSFSTAIGFFFGRQSK
jgi:hypothetical protein